jgi:hypothetical protein
VPEELSAGLEEVGFEERGHGFKFLVSSLKWNTRIAESLGFIVGEFVWVD